MSRCAVTGAAGFIGSHLCEALVAEGHEVVGLDAFIPYYERAVKENNVRDLLAADTFSLHEVDLRFHDFGHLLNGVDVVFHLAAMPGLLRSWREFDLYTSCNLQATQRLLEAVRGAGVPHLIHGSTSSVYGRYATGPEDSPVEPVSPYGITKLAAEHLCRAYAATYDLPITILRFFSVYGPRQRPDMGYHIFIRALLNGEAITVYGDGEDSRSNTFVSDCVRGILLAFEKCERSVGEIFNIGGGEVVSVNQVLGLLEELTGTRAQVVHGPPRQGDQRRTAANIHKARRLLGYQPSTPVRVGLHAQLDWQRASGQADRAARSAEAAAISRYERVSW